VGRLGGSGNNGGNRDGSRSRSTLALIVGRADTATVGDELRNVWAKTSFSSGGVREGGGLFLSLDRICLDQDAAVAAAAAAVAAKAGGRGVAWAKAACRSGQLDSRNLGNEVPARV
jgi:hypothetical protein